ncbi:MAG: hypothetical protein ACPH6D_07275 [Candidatus Puniceispirillales bacterium]
MSYIPISGALSHPFPEEVIKTAIGIHIKLQNATIDHGTANRAYLHFIFRKGADEL